MSASKRRSITLDFKRKIVLLIETKIKTQADIVRDYALSKSTVSDIWSNREKYKTSSQFADGSKKMRKSTYDDVEDALFLWLKQARSLGAPVSGPILKEKAVRLAVELGHNDFKCSDGWLDRFKKRRAVIFHYKIIPKYPVYLIQKVITMSFEKGYFFYCIFVFCGLYPISNVKPIGVFNVTLHRITLLLCTNSRIVSIAVLRTITTHYKNHLKRT
uniref:HTH CENPB-type domain-containing protein n=1 Tax=Paramormyrops kingsleyae TaxID=1676925 RepID=A0A3B3R5J0_9TELE